MVSRNRTLQGLRGIPVLGMALAGIAHASVFGYLFVELLSHQFARRVDARWRSRAKDHGKPSACDKPAPPA